LVLQQWNFSRTAPGDTTALRSKRNLIEVKARLQHHFRSQICASGKDRIEFLSPKLQQRELAFNAPLIRARRNPRNIIYEYQSKKSWNPDGRRPGSVLERRHRLFD
jgi:hypothetical protein